MDDFLVDGPKSTFECSSIDDLKLHLGTLRETKVTDTKAEHITATFEFRPTAVFHVPESENDAAETSNQQKATDPAPSDGPAANGASLPTRAIRAHETLMNQPADDPVLQKVVAKHLIANLGAVDGSAWAVRSLSRTSSGWTFQYLCKSSTQAWLRQNAKKDAKALVGESSGKDGQDPVNLARPAFDCRGFITIAFTKSNRKITVKLEHTPFHKTVAELAELFKPPPPPARTEASRRNGESKKRKTQPEAEGEEGGEEGGTVRKKRKRNTTADPNNLSALPKLKKPRAPKAGKAAANGPIVAAPPDGQQDPILNLSPTETARRRDEANKKLSEAGIDPATLSTEQFDIFSNQSPDLQRESLAMLVKYGAERLRIVHPIKDNDSVSPASANGATPSTPDGSTRKKKSKKNTSNEDGTPKVKKTRGRCQACTAKKVKCSKKKPECTECVEAGISCYYRPEKKRERKDKPTDVNGNDHPDESVVEAQEQEQNQQQEATDAPQPEVASVPEEETSDLGSPGFSGSHDHVSSVMAQSADTSTTYPEVTAHDLYPSTETDLAYPQAIPDAMSNGMDYSAYSNQAIQRQQQQPQQQSALTSMAYPQLSGQTSNVAYPDPAPAVQPPPVTVAPVQAPPPAPASAPVPTRATRPPSSRSAARRSLPSGNSHVHNGYAEAVNSDGSSTWQATNIQPAAATTTETYSHTHPTRPEHRSRNPASYDTTSQHDDLRAAATLSQTALQKVQPSPTARTASPFQNPTQAARAKSRQGQRAQSRTTARASPFQQAPAQTASVATASIYSNPSTADTSGYDQYSHYNAGHKQASSRGAYEPFAHQPAAMSTSTSTASYPNYNAYSSRSQASTASHLAAPVTQSMSTSYTKTAAPSSTGWGNSHGSNNAAASTTQQSFPARPQENAHASKANSSTHASTQPKGRQQQSFASYSAQQPHNTTSSQPQPQAQQDWYGFGSNNNAASTFGSGGRDPSYGQSGSGNASYPQHRSMNLSGSTYHNMNDQDLYEMLRTNPGH